MKLGRWMFGFENLFSNLMQNKPRGYSHKIPGAMRMINPGYVNNFNSLLKAIKNGDACLLEVWDREKRKEVISICAVNRDQDGGVTFVPFAIMIDGNPYKQFDPPDPSGGFRHEDIEAEE